MFYYGQLRVTHDSEQSHLHCRVQCRVTDHSSWKLYEDEKQRHWLSSKAGGDSCGSQGPAVLPLGIPSVRHLFCPVHSAQLLPPGTEVIKAAVLSQHLHRKASLISLSSLYGGGTTVCRRRTDFGLREAGFQTWFFHLGQLTDHPWDFASSAETPS